MREGVVTTREMAYKTAYPDRYGLLKEFARENRKNQTLAESVLWEKFDINLVIQQIKDYFEKGIILNNSYNEQ